MCTSKDCRDNSAIPTMCFFFGYLLSHGRKSKLSFLESQPVWCINPDKLRSVNYKIPYIPWVQISRVVPQRPKILGQMYPHFKKKTHLSLPRFLALTHWPLPCPSFPSFPFPPALLAHRSWPRWSRAWWSTRSSAESSRHRDRGFADQHCLQDGTPVR